MFSSSHSTFPFVCVLRPFSATRHKFVKNNTPVNSAQVGERQSVDSGFLKRCFNFDDSCLGSLFFIKGEVFPWNLNKKGECNLIVTVNCCMMDIDRDVYTIFFGCTPCENNTLCFHALFRLDFVNCTWCKSHGGSICACQDRHLFCLHTCIAFKL